jgi:hypothetical protein
MNKAVWKYKLSETKRIIFFLKLYKAEKEVTFILSLLNN